ncbi:MAG: PQQ-dependent sugar dehydrogenase [Gammaproteobacteria bacterium]
MKRLFRDLALMVIAAALLWLLLPERFAVNVPIALLGWGNAPPSTATVQNRLRLPAGFSIRIYASGLPGARILRVTHTGDLLLSLPGAGRIVLLERDTNGDGSPDGRRDLLTGLNRPHGLDLHQGWLYVAESNAVGRIRFHAGTRSVSGDYDRIVTGLPGGGAHWSRSVRFGPDNWMYVSVGSSCNACEERDPRRAAMLRFRPDGSSGEIYATGLRNTVGFDWRPGTNELYGTDMGRDFLGDDFPPCELNRIERTRFYGWPYANGEKKVPDPDFDEGHQARINDSVAPVHEFAAHSSPLGISFLRDDMLPPAYEGAALVALHGSWNRTEKQGYAVVSLHFDGSDNIEERPLVTGFEIYGDVIGRPVDAAQGLDGTIFISDDFTGSVYLVIYSKTEGL